MVTRLDTSLFSGVGGIVAQPLTFTMPLRYSVCVYAELCLGLPLGAIDKKVEAIFFHLASEPKPPVLVIVEVSDIHSSTLFD